MLNDAQWLEWALGRKQVLRSKIQDLENELEELTSSIHKACPHDNVVSRTDDLGYDKDNGYGKWWKEPCFECKKCGLIERGYSTLLEKSLPHPRNCGCLEFE